jgi:transmembrane sensor
MPVWKRIGKNVVRLITPASIDREAIRWVVRMDSGEPLSDAEKKALREWASRSVLHRNALLRFEKFWSEADVLALLKTSPEYEVSRRTGRSGAILLAAGAAILAAGMLIYLGVRVLGGAEPLIYETAVGEQRTVPLPDGSTLQLNTNSRTQVAYSTHLRRIRLLRGEALFSVTADSQRVFEVFVADRIVRAMGTAFVIRLDGSAVEVMVTEGTVDVADVASGWSGTDGKWVKVNPHTASLGQLRAGEVGDLNTGSRHMEVRRLADYEVQRRMAWREGFLAFSDEPLSAVVAQLNRYSRTTLEIGDPKLASLKISGRFRIGDRDGVFDLLRQEFGIRVRSVEGGDIRLEVGGGE